MKKYTVLGMMSGTSLDGIDAALITTDGENYIERHGFITQPYPDALRDSLRACLNRPVAEARAAERAMTEAHAAAALRLIDETGIDRARVELIGFHGQTISHAPEQGSTCQIGDAALLMSLTGIPVVNDFRSADVAAGGQGAPLAPVYHRALAAGLGKPVVFLNIGGVANVTYIAADGGLSAFDTGPGNALIDDWLFSKTGQRYDAGGKTAAAGTVDQDVLAQLMAHPFFAARPPKSLDRDAFKSGLWAELSLEDGAATLTEFTVASIARARDFMPDVAATWVVCGGGRLNDALMQSLRARLGVEVVPVETIGQNGDAIEAEAFAYMAVRSLRGLPISFPGTTGVPEPMTGGRFHGAQSAA